jgi:hypothetical protein
MRERYVIVATLVGFVALLTSPLWLARSAGPAAASPALVLPSKATACVMPLEYMRTSHMDLLNTWRDLAVRQNVHSWSAPDGTSYRIGLTGTCLGCHTNKAEFCDRCHEYAAVTPTCWDCHVSPPSSTLSVARSRP